MEQQKKLHEDRNHFLENWINLIVQDLVVITVRLETVLVKEKVKWRDLVVNLLSGRSREI